MGSQVISMLVSIHPMRWLQQRWKETEKPYKHLPTVCWVAHIKCSSLAIALAILGTALFAAHLYGQEPTDSPAASSEVTPLTTGEFLAELDKLATKCDDLGLPEKAAETRNWWPRERTDQAWLAFAMVEPSNTEPSSDLISKWEARFETLRQRHSLHLIEQAKNLLDGGDELHAYRLIWRAYREDPTNKQAKFVLQNLLNSERAESKPRLSTTKHPKFGWEAKTFHRIQLPHFRIVSNADPQIIAAWADQLERLYLIWTQAYPELWLAPGALKNRLAGKNVPLERKSEMDFVLFRSREEYLKQLGINEARIDSSVGYYAPQESSSYFYVDGKDIPLATVAHELTHQILQEASVLRGSEPWETNSDFWVVEAIALHAESLWIGKNFATVGGWESPRLQVARYRSLRENFWIPWEELRKYSAQSWKEQPEISKSYTQSAGLAHYWLDHADPKAREAFFSYLVSVYRNKPSLDKMQELVPIEQWKTEYEDHLQVSKELLYSLNPDRHLEQCVLIGCEMGERGLEFLVPQSDLKWLDLSFLPISDNQTNSLAKLTQLERLSLEGTAIGDPTLEQLLSLKDLEELDLSGTKVSDSGLEALKKLPNLETLWLTNTPITDNSLQLLEELKTLQFLQVDGTQITSDGWKKLIQARPELGAEKQ